MKPVIVVVLKGYPRLSETFIAQELLELERAGYDLRLVSLRHPTDRKRHPINDEIRAPVTYLPEYLHDEPVRVLKAWWKVRRLPGYGKAVRHWLKDLSRDATRNRIRRFGQALVLAAECPAGARWIYSHFIHTPSSVARYSSEMTGIAWSASAHAKDIWTSPDWELSEKLAAAAWTVTCTAGGARHLKDLSPDAAKVALVYHGIDLARFPMPRRDPSRRDGADAADPVRILSVGRAVAKKGLDTLADALALLPHDLSWQWTHVGGGELADDLKAQVERLGLAERVAIHGSRAQSEVLEAYAASDLFVLPCRIADDGDRDGLPNVLVEAQSQGLACISTPISGIPELIDDGRTGILVPANDPAALAAAMADAIRSPDLRARIGTAAMERVHAHFDHRGTIGQLIALFEANGLVGDKPREMQAS
ncbi:glycosyltransferase family 4 protein [Aquibium sp. ELW1220]|uniref:glycosyltransferase family 4 protein n=1 Tax=Aquibium sp. ELW1220 TaxID=2976766 RepID=UPI0025B1F526|nr:glycosyltransferase family 4 protein [Aquibium sp. ELW1220]MDN2580818.1 glycosyltransferase family 4 protein [Aquibium sp. ELW1220]